MLATSKAVFLIKSVKYLPVTLTNSGAAAICFLFGYESALC